MIELGRFDVGDLEALADAVRGFSADAASMEQVGQRIVEHLHRELVFDGAPAVVLARLYRSMYVEDLDDELRRFAERTATEPLKPDASCLVLVATAGEEEGWNDRRQSQGHAAIPLEDPAAIERSPMVAALFRDLGFDMEVVLSPRPYQQLHHDRGRGVFYVADAGGNRAIPAQEEFVRPYGVKSVVGVGGFLPSGDLFALIMFLRAEVPRSVAEMFTTVGLSVKATLTPYTFRTFTT